MIRVRKTSLRCVVAAMCTLMLLPGAFAAAPAVAANEGPEIIRDVWHTTVPVDPHSAADGNARLRTDTFLTMDQDPEGDLPRELAFTPDGTQIAVVNRDTDNVTFFDAATRQPLATVPVGDFPVHIAISADGTKAVVPNVLDNSVSVIDAVNHTLLRNVPITGEQPYRVAITPDSAHAIVGVINDGTSSTFSVIDLDALNETNSYAGGSQGVFGFFFSPEIAISGNIFTQFALSPDGAKLVQADRTNSRITIYDPISGFVYADLGVRPLPTAVDISADSTVAVVSHEGNEKQITEVDLVNNAIAQTHTTASNLSNQAIRISPDKSHALAAISNNLIFVNLTTGVTTATISTGTVGDIEFSFDGQYAFVSNFNARVIDIGAQTLVDTITYAACVEAATSPTEYRAVALNNRFRENIHFYNINGSGGFLEGAILAGEPAEGDVTSFVDVASDGSIAVVGNLASGNVSIVDLATKSIRAYVDVGDRIKDLRITPDGNYAVVCAMDANQVGIIDLNSDTLVASLPIFNRPGRVRISPDGQWAYVLNVAGTDRISFIQLDGQNSSIVSQESAGQTGSANGFTFSETSGIELTADGDYLAVCDSFNDLLRIFDTATRTQVAAVTVGDFPIRVGFTPDGTRAYVTNAFGDSVSVVQNAGGAWSLLTTIPNIDFPLTVDVNDAGTYTFIGNAGNASGIRVIDTTTNAVVRTLQFSDGYPRDTHYAAGEGLLYAASTDANLRIIDDAGPASAIVDTLPLESGPLDLAYSPVGQVVVIAEPPVDGVDIFRFAAAAPGDMNCDGVINNFDIDPFVLALTDPDGYAAAYPNCDINLGDINGDGAVNNFDIDPFVALLTGG